MQTSTSAGRGNGLGTEGRDGALRHKPVGQHDGSPMSATLGT